MTMDDAEYELNEDVLAVIPAGKGYAIHNTGKKPLRMITVSAPPLLPSRGATSAKKPAATAARSR